jgi:hypothetical protein
VAAANKQHVQVIVGYLENGYCGTAKVTVLSAGTITVWTDIDPVFCRKGWLDFLT